MLYPLKVNLNNWGYQLDVVFVSLTDCGFREVSRKRIYYNSYILNTASKLEKFHVSLTWHYKTKIYTPSLCCLNKISSIWRRTKTLRILILSDFLLPCPFSKNYSKNVWKLRTWSNNSKVNTTFCTVLSTLLQFPKRQYKHVRIWQYSLIQFHANPFISTVL